MLGKKTKSATVGIIINDIQLNYSLKSSRYFKKNKIYLDLSNGAYKIDNDLICKIGFEKIVTDNVNLTNSKLFLQSYLDLIAKIGVENNHRTWWGTEISSKNRFTAQLPELLFKFVQCAYAIENEAFDELLILLPNKTLVNPIKKIIRKSNKNIKITRYRFANSFDYNFDVGIIKSVIIVRHALMVKNGINLYFKSVLARLYLKRKSFSKIALEQQSCFLIKSHVYEKSFNKNNHYYDQFFGKFAKSICNQKDVLFLVHIHGNYRRVLKNIKENEEYNIVPFEYFVKFINICSAIYKIYFARIKIENISFYGFDVTEIVYEEIKRSGIVLTHWLMHECVKNMLNLFVVERAYLTYEGIAWENMFIMSMREHSPLTKLFGYQHAVVPQSSAGMFIGKSEKYIKPLPDKILTVGTEAKNIIIDHGHYSDNFVESSCALRYEYLNKIVPKVRHQTSSILVALEGVPEVYRIVNYVLSHAERLKKFAITIRTHPIFPWSKICPNVIYDLNSFSNVSLSSKNSVIDDLNQADICIYWGSTVSLEALSMGIPLIHYNMQTILSNDPLFRCNTLKWTVTDNDSLAEVVESISALDDDNYSQQTQQAREYISRYFFPVTKENLDKFL